jgi:hypothetical protein
VPHHGGRWHLERFAEPGQRGFVFVGPKGGQLRRSNFHRTWDKARTSVGLPGLHFHDLRHTGGTLSEMSGVASSASFGSFGERALPGPQRVALRRSQRDGTWFSARDLGRQQQVASGAWMRHLIRLQQVTICCSQGNVQERSEGRSSKCPVAG